MCAAAHDATPPPASAAASAMPFHERSAKRWRRRCASVRPLRGCRYFTPPPLFALSAARQPPALRRRDAIFSPRLMLPATPLPLYLRCLHVDFRRRR